MGQTIQNLSTRKISKTPVFSNRFCVEVCEKMHTHYKNLRIVNTIHDWVKMAEGMADALQRWKVRGKPMPSAKNHIELCRKIIESESDNDVLMINLNKNLYPQYKDKIFSEGANIEDENYIHLKIRDFRIELSISDFKELCHATKEANEKLENSCNLSVV